MCLKVHDIAILTPKRTWLRNKKGAQSQTAIQILKTTKLPAASFGVSERNCGAANPSSL
jgi:hypothetical protein